MDYKTTAEVQEPLAVTPGEVLLGMFSLPGAFLSGFDSLYATLWTLQLRRGVFPDAVVYNN